MRETLLASRYAKSLFDLSLEMKVLEPVMQDMEKLLGVCKSNKDFDRMLKSPVIRPDKKLSILEILFRKEMQELTFKFMQLITRNKRENYLSEIARQFILKYKEYHDITTTYVKTAVPLSEEMRNKIIQIMEKYTKGNIELIEELDESLIGGFLLSFDDMQYDASLSREISRLKAEFEKNLYKRGI
jgi:F-type H+-transporting ATPase subunit delta